MDCLKCIRATQAAMEPMLCRECEEFDELKETRPKCCLTSVGLECIGDGHGGCGWHGCEDAATRMSCNYTWVNGIGITSYVLDENGEDEVWLCPKCEGECTHTPLDEIQFEETSQCECQQEDKPEN